MGPVSEFTNLVEEQHGGQHEQREFKEFHAADEFARASSLTESAFAKMTDAMPPTAENMRFGQHEPHQLLQ